MIEANGLSKNYGGIKALQSVSFTIGANEVVGLLGPNGAGKTTLMKLLTGFLHPSEGQARIDGLSVLDEPLAVQQRIGYLPENAPVYREMVVQEYLRLMAEMRQIPQSKQDELISDAVRATGLEKYLVRSIGQLSKGYRQRVGLAQAILHRPKVLILDEPTTGLDPSQIVEIRALIKELARDATVLLSTHILPEVELTCERVLIITEGEVRTDAKLDDLRTSSSAIAVIDGTPAEVEQALREIPDVNVVRGFGAKLGDDPTVAAGFTRYRVSGEHDDLCPRIFDVVRKNDWRLAELRPDQQNLETIFRRVAEGGAA